MASSLIIHKRIRTTLAKARVLREYVEPLITRSKEDTTNNRREVFSYLQDNKAVTELFRVVSQKVADRPGGYTRILKLENRLGDNAQMCYIELVDFNELYTKGEVLKKGAKRTRRGGKKAEPVAAVKKAAAVAVPKKDKAVEEEPLAEMTQEQEVEVDEETIAEVVGEHVEGVEDEPVAAAEEGTMEPPEEGTTGEDTPEEKNDKQG